MDPVSPKPMRRLPIDLIEMEIAFDNTSPEMSYYLDLETGRVVLVTSEARKTLEAGEADEDGEVAEDVPDWMQETIEDARRIATAAHRYVEIPSQDSHEGFRDMQDFIGTVGNESLRERLWDAIQGRGAFRRFRDILGRYPEERERWFEFEQDCSMQRIMDWLADRGIEPVAVEDDSGKLAPAVNGEPSTGC
jgi:hypothetical protein